MSTTRARRRAVLPNTRLLLVSAVVVGATSLWTPVAAAEDVGDLVVEAPPAYFTDMAPGERRYWPVTARLAGAESGSLALRVHGSGGLVDHPRHGLRIEVHSCTAAYPATDPAVRPRCRGEAGTILPEQPLAAVSSMPTAAAVPHTWRLRDIVAGQDRHFLVTLSLPVEGADDQSLMGLSARFGVGLYAAGDISAAGGPDPDPAPPGRPPRAGEPPTGEPADPEGGAPPRTSRPDPGGPGPGLPEAGGPAAAVLLLGAAALAAGVALLRRARRS